MPVTSSYFESPTVTPSASDLVFEEKSAIATAKDMLFVDTAVGKYLTALGHNYGIKRPKLAPADDDLYRKIIQAIALLPKTILSTLYFLMQAVFGTQASIVAQNQRPWRIYQVNPNELIIEVPLDLLGASNENATYFHGFTGQVLSGATTTIFSCSGNARGSAVNLVGLGCSVLINGVYEEKLITIATYSAITDQTQITVGSVYSASPVAGTHFFINVPGDGVSSDRGDYLGQTAFVQSVATSVGANSLTDTTLAMTPGQYVGYYLHFAPEGAYKITANTATSFTLAANGGTPPSGAYFVALFYFDADEEVDGVATPPHADRIYVTGDGKFEVVKQYLLEVVKTAGVVLRFEKV